MTTRDQVAATRDELHAAWIQLSHEVLKVAEAMTEQADPGADREEEVKVKIWATVLLCRSVNNYRGMLLLLGSNLIVEARTLARCLHENLFRMGYLVKKSHEAVVEWQADDNRSTKAFTTISPRRING